MEATADSAQAIPPEPSGKSSPEKVACRQCGALYHRLDIHIPNAHDMSLDEYQDRYPGAPLRSEHAEAVMDEAARPAPTKGLSGKGEYAIGVARLTHRRGLDEEDKVFIPEHDDDWEPGMSEAKALEDLALGVQVSDNVLIVGPTGAGKSLLVMQLAAAIGQPMRRVPLHGDVRAADFAGEKVVDVDVASGQAIVMWRDGILPQAMRRGHWLLLDEIDAGPAAIMFVLQGVLEVGKRLVLMGNEGEVVKAHPRFRIIATANTLGRGDESGLYTGTRILNEAFLDRFGTVIEFDYPSEDTEVKILVARSGIEPEKALMLVRSAHMVREAFERSEVSCTFSTRRLVAWAVKVQRYGNIRRAATVSVLNKLSREDKVFVDGIIQRHVGEA